jgi:hypothetical protein
MGIVVSPRDLPSTRVRIITVATVGRKAVEPWVRESAVLSWDETSEVDEAAAEA